MGDWPLHRGTNAFAMLGADTTLSRGTTVSAPATANTKGSYAQLVAAAPFEANGFWLHINGSAGAGVYCLIDIAVGGAGAEVVVVPNLAYTRDSQVSCEAVWLPVSIPAGVRVAARMQSSAATAQSLRLSATLIPAAPTIPPAFGRCEEYNVNTATSRDTTSVDPGATINTKGSWAQLTAGTGRRISSLLLAIGASGDVARAAAADILLDVATGASGSEVVLVANLPLYAGTSEDAPQPKFLGPFPVDIPDSTRLAARAQSSNATASDRLVGVCGYGFA